MEKTLQKVFDKYEVRTRISIHRDNISNMPLVVIMFTDKKTGKILEIPTMPVDIFQHWGDKYEV